MGGQVKQVKPGARVAVAGRHTGGAHTFRQAGSSAPYLVVVEQHDGRHHHLLVRHVKRHPQGGEVVDDACCALPIQA